MTEDNHTLDFIYIFKKLFIGTSTKQRNDIINQDVNNKLSNIDTVCNFNKLQFQTIYRMPSIYRFFTLSLNTLNIASSDNKSITWNLSTIYSNNELIKVDYDIKNIIIAKMDKQIYVNTLIKSFLNIETYHRLMYICIKQLISQTKKAESIYFPFHFSFTADKSGFSIYNSTIFLPKYENNIFHFYPPINEIKNQITFNIINTGIVNNTNTILYLNPIWYEATITYANPLILTITNYGGYYTPNLATTPYVIIKGFTTSDPVADEKNISALMSDDGIPVISIYNGRLLFPDMPGSPIGDINGPIRITLNFDGTVFVSPISNLVISFIYSNDIVQFNLELLTLIDDTDEY